MIAEEAGSYSFEEIANASTEELRGMLGETSAACRIARAAAAHQNMQYNLLVMEFSESVKRMQVELEMSHKEVEVLQAQGQRRNSSITTPAKSGQQFSSSSPQDHQVTVLRDRNKLLELENDDLEQRLDDLKSLMLDREKQAEEEIGRLKDRIRENRKHVNLLRRANGNAEGSPLSVLNTPQMPSTRRSQRGNADADRFTTPKTRGSDQLLEAARFLEAVSQEAATTPSTPTPHLRKPQATTGLHHHRGSQSLSSLPSTPLQARSVPTAIPRTPYYFNPNPKTPAALQTAPSRPVQADHRHESRDSTISASDIGDGAPHEGAEYVSDEFSDVSDAEGNGTILESQASREARTMLRKSASRSFPNSPEDSFQKQRHQWARDAGSPLQRKAGENTRSARNLKQSTIYGKPTKPGLGIEGAGLGASKRKMGQREVSQGVAGGASKGGKKGRFGSEGVGLGIGGWTSSPRR